ncbi:hypothetical protein Asi03nite_00510 [Actinoplanes siamensis]|uniref:Uncharacterized protein n=1 Tax=Actinoplanes siamensis TaxID=1223317 RepID=A0A919KAJ4_9ACTN|nr:hypothetical protein Asi03nite_00510 [Actinoplanes siamensis]
MLRRWFAATQDGVIFGSEPKAILAHPDFRAVLDADGLRDIPGHAMFRGMREVKPGHTVRVSRAGLTGQAYWRLAVREHTDSLEQTTSSAWRPGSTSASPSPIRGWSTTRSTSPGR